MAAPEGAGSQERASQSGTASRDGAPPQVRIAARTGGASGAALQAGDIEILLPDHVQAAVLADAAHALLRWCAALPTPQVSAERSLAALCHDLRTPLSVMAGWLHLMRSGKLDEAGMKRAVERLQASLEQQIQLLDRMLEVQGGGRK